MSTWNRVDERVLRWLLEQDSNPDWLGQIDQLTLHAQPEPRPEFSGELDSREVDETLTRLLSYDLIAGVRGETVSFAHWARLRLTDRGLIVLGQWPDLDRAASFEGLTVLIARLAERVTDEGDKTALRQTAGAIGRLGEGIVDSALESLGGELGAV